MTKSDKRNIKIGTIIAYANVVASVLVNVFFLPILLKYVGDGQYGIYSFALSISSLLTVLSFGMTSGYIRFASIAKKEEGEEGVKKINTLYFLFFIIASFLALLIGAVVFILFATRSLPLSNYSFEEITLLEILFAISLINVCVNFLSYVFTLNVSFNVKYIWGRSINLLVTILIPCVSIGIIVKTGNIVYYSLCGVAINLFALLANILFCIKRLKFKIGFKYSKELFKSFKSILIFSIYVFVISLVTQLDAQTDKILLGFYSRPETVAIYQLGLSLVNYVTIASTTVCSMYVPIVNKEVVDGNHCELNETFITVSSKMQLLYLFVVGGFFVCGKEFVYAWLGVEEQYKFVYYITLILSAIHLVPYTMNLASEIQRAKNLHKFRAIAMLLGAILNISLTSIYLSVLPYFADPSLTYFYKYQIIGCLICTAISTIIFSVVVMSVYNVKVVNLPIKRYYIKLIYNTIPVVVSALICHFVFKYVPQLRFVSHWANVIFEGALFALLFIACFVALNFKNIKDLLISRKKSTQSVATFEQKTSFEPVIVFKDKYYIVSIDDCYNSFKNLIINKKVFNSFFDEPFFKKMKELHTKYGIVFTCFVENANILSKVPSKWRDDFVGCNWIKFGFHSGRIESYTFIDAPLAKDDYVKFVENIIRITGSETFVDRNIRLHLFKGSSSALVDLSRCKSGARLFLCADDDRKSYYLDENQTRQLNETGYYIDNSEQIIFVKCSKRLVFDKSPKKHDDISRVITFFHEWDFYTSGIFDEDKSRYVDNYFQSLVIDGPEYCFLDDAIKIEEGNKYAQI